MSDLSNSVVTPEIFDYLVIVLNEAETRCWNLLKKLALKHTIIKHLIILGYNNEPAKEEKDIKDILKENGLKENFNHIHFIAGNKTQHLPDFDSIRSMITDFDKVNAIGMDLTCLPVPLFFLLMKWFSKNTKKLFIYYTQPGQYILSDGLFASYFSMKGPVSVDEIYGFSGIAANDSDGKRLLACMLGFDNDLLPMIIQEAGPNKVIAINGFPSYYPKFKDISLANNQRVLSGAGYVGLLEKTKKLSDYVYVEAINPFEAYNAINDIVKEFKEYCIDVVPLGTKPMALGACLYAIDDTNVRIIFPNPETYVSNISRESKKTVEYVIEFNR